MLIFYEKLFRNNPENIHDKHFNICHIKLIICDLHSNLLFNYKIEIRSNVLEELKIVCFVWICSRSPIDRVLASVLYHGEKKNL